MREWMDNPAGRLAFFIRSLPQRNQDRSIGEILGLDPNLSQPFAAALRMLEVQKLMQATKEAVEKLPESEDPNFLLLHFNDIEKFINGLTEMALSAASRINPADMFNSLFAARKPGPEALFALEACSRALHRCSPEPALEQEQLTTLVEDVREIMDAVIASPSLATEAKEFLVLRLREIESALLHSKIAGTAELEASVDRLTGALVRREDIREPGLMGKIGTFFQRLVQAAQGTEAITGATKSTIEAINALTNLPGSS
ncbi:hypothetical protein AB0F49_15635 [Micromonospora ureilytica]|uniref:hypothetical protein n=1 Tax=Micromonospora ureilytica TaxID=709868 RepID=UPI0033C85C6D